jgi:5'-nucleotidase
MRRYAAAAVFVMALVAGLATLAWTRATATPAQVTLSIVGTNDLHGGIGPDPWARGGLTVFGGYVENLRAARAADRGAVLLLDAGDTFQATTATMRGLESNLSEGAVVVDAYNALGYDALAIGNHDFEFGSADGAPHLAADQADLRGALKALAARARFPLLTANIHEVGTGRPLGWPNVRPSTIVETAGVRVGLIGVMTFDGLSRTLVANVGGLTTTPLVPAIAEEAERLRRQGADVVVLVAHAGGRCEDTANAHDLSSCDPRSEIFEVVRGLPRGTLQAIVAGHTHGSMAHVFEGVPVTSVPEGGIQFGRTDLTIDTATRRVLSVRPFAPRNICLRENPATGDCQAEGNGVASQYEGRVVQASRAVEAAMAPGLATVRGLRARPLGVAVDAAIERLGTPESPLGNLFADAIRETAGVEAAISYGGGRGGLRAALPPGPLTFGALYDTFPFDNRVVRSRVTGAQLVETLEGQLTQRRRGLVSLSGLRGVVRCDGTRPRVTLMRDSGERVGPRDELLVASTAYSASRIVWEPAAGDEGAAVSDSAPLVREIVEQWLRRRGGHIGPRDFYDAARPRWSVPAQGFSCGA